MHGHQPDVPRLTAIERLRHVPPPHNGKSLGDQALDTMIQTVLMDAPKEGASSGTIRASVVDAYGVAYEAAEVRFALERLIKEPDRPVVGTGRGTYTLAPERQTALAQEARSYANDRHECFDKVRTVLYAEGHPLTDEQFEQLTEQLEHALAKLLHDYGVRATRLFLGSGGGAAEVPEPDTSPYAAGLTIDTEVGRAIATRTLEMLLAIGRLHHPAYLAHLFDSACVIRAAIIDPNLSSSIASALAGTVFYLDTNVLYALLGFDGDEQKDSFFALKRALEQLGAELAVTPQTIAELRTSLRTKTNHLRRHPIKSRNLARTASELTDMPDLMTTFNRKYADRGSTLDDLDAMVNNIEALLQALAITLEAEESEIEVSPEQIVSRASALRTYLETDSRGLPIGQPKRDEIHEHDAYHQLLVAAARGGTVASFSQAKVWFLTFQTRLARAELAVSPEARNGVPTTVSVDDLFPVLRCFLPRTDAEYEKAFAHLVVSPYLTPHYSVPSATVQMIFSRLEAGPYMEGLDDASLSELGAYLFIDENLRAQLVSIPTDTEPAKLDEMLVPVLERAVEELSSKAKARELAATEALGRLQTEVEGERREKHKLQAEIDEHKRVIAEYETMLNKAQQARKEQEKTTQENDSRWASMRTHALTLSRDAAAQRRWLFFFVALLGLPLLYVYLPPAALAWLDDSPIDAPRDLTALWVAYALIGFFTVIAMNRPSGSRNCILAFVTIATSLGIALSVGYELAGYVLTGYGVVAALLVWRYGHHERGPA